MSDSGPGEWAEKEAFVMPVLPKELGVDPFIAVMLHCMAFLELSGDDAVDPDWAVEAMEHAVEYLKRLDPVAVDKLERTLTNVADYGREHDYPSEFVDLLDSFLSAYGLKDEPTSDD